ncbi:MAG: hypothetical protein ACPGJV_03050 [Bacteriovoracaceae bacterium]
MKRIITLFNFLFFSTFAFSNVMENELYKQVYYAEVVVLETPLLLEPKLSAPVSQLKRKGDKIRVRLRNVGISPHEISYEASSETPSFARDSEGNDFYESIDSIGRTVYIPRKHLRVIHDDGRDNEHKFITQDDTDYRIYEPITEEYPFYDQEKRKLFWSYGLGSAHQTNYTYPRKIQRETVNFRHQVDLAYMKKVPFDPLDRFYYGFYLHLHGDSATFVLEDGITANEARGQLGIGPILSYEFFRRGNIGITLWGSLTVNYDRMFIHQISDNGESEERIFQGFGLTPKLATQFHLKEIIPWGDIVLGVQTQFNIAYELSSSSGISNADLWNEDDDNYNYPLGGVYTFFFGTQSEY